MNAASVPRDIRFFPCSSPWIEIRKRDWWPEVWWTRGGENLGIYLLRWNENGTCSFSLSSSLKAVRTRTYTTNGGAAEINLWARWTVVDTMAAFNSTLSTYRGTTSVVTTVTNFSSDSGVQWYHIRVCDPHKGMNMLQACAKILLKRTYLLLYTTKRTDELTPIEFIHTYSYTIIHTI